MDPSTPRVVTLSLEPGRAPAGQIVVAAGPAVAFVGWLDLLAQLDHILDDSGGGDLTDTSEQEQPT